ncbi:VWA domain-containing protein [Nocardia thailandica]
MGTHRSSENTSRGISKGPVLAASMLVLVLVAVVAWFQFSDRAENKDSAAASECVEGPAALDVTVDPAVAGPVRAAADKFNAAKPRVRDHCAQVKVIARPSAAMVAGFAAAGGWDPALGPKPGLWIADSSRSIELVRVPGLIEGTPASIATSPIVLAVPEDLRRALEENKIGWGDLPRLQQGSLGDVGLGSWGPLRMAMPAGDASTAAALAAGSAVSGFDPLTEQAAATGQVVAAISGLAASAPPSADVLGVMTATGPDPATAEVHAVPATEQQIRASGGLSAFRPAGSAPLADYPAALMSGPWVDKTQNLIASRFVDFLRAPEQVVAASAEGFAPAIGAAPPQPTRATLEKVQATLNNPVLGVVSTALLDVSASMGAAEGAATRLANASAALLSTMTVMPADFGLGLWTFAKNLDGSSPYKEQTPTATLTDDQRTALAKAFTAAKATDSRTDQAYPSLLAAYKAAIANWSAGHANSVLLITDGPDDDSALTGSALLTDLAAAAVPGKPVRIDVIAIGGTAPQTLQQAAQQTGGTFTTVTTTNDLAFGTAVSKALTTT